MTLCFLFLISIVLNAVVVYTRLSTDLQRVCFFIVLLFVVVVIIILVLLLFQLLVELCVIFPQKKQQSASQKECNCLSSLKICPNPPKQPPDTSLGAIAGERTTAAAEVPRVYDEVWCYTPKS